MTNCVAYLGIKCNCLKCRGLAKAEWEARGEINE